jgi:NDP-sugar pyrophosphorylase family protein
MTKIKHKKKRTKAENPVNAIDELITIVILCDLPGYRMKSYGPTSLVKIDKKLLIDTQLDCLKKCFPNNEIILCVGFDGEKISKYIRSKYKNHNIRIVENQLFNICNSCEGLRISINNTFNKKILIIDGNLLVNKKTLSLIDTHKTCAIVEKNPSENLEIGININQNNIAEHFSFGAYKTWSEIMYLCGEEIIETLRKFLNNQDSKKKFIFEAINDLLKNNHSIFCIENKFPIYKINNIKTYHSIKDNHEIFNI